MLLPRLDVMDSNYTTLYRIADDAVFNVHVPRTPAAETVGCHLDSSFVIFHDYGVVVDRRRQEALHLSKETELIYNFCQRHRYCRASFFAALQCFAAAMPSTALMLAWRASCPSISLFPRALPIWPIWRRLCFAERGRLRRYMVDVHRAHWSLERGSVANASRATLRDGLRGIGKRVVQFSYAAADTS